jgi:hypothetical protein
LFMILAQLFFLWVLAGGQLNRRIMLTGVIGLIAAISFFPVVLALRVFRTTHRLSATQAISFLAAMSSSLGDVFHHATGRDSDNVGVSIMTLMLGRVTGANVLLPIAELRPHFLGWNVIHVANGMHGIIGYFTSEIIGMGENFAADVSLAPGLLGFFYILYGNTAVIAGVVAFTASMLIIWRYIPRFTLVSRRAAQVTFLNALIIMALDGGVQQFTLHVLPFWIGSIALAEWLGSRGVRRHITRRCAERFAPPGSVAAGRLCER